MILEELARPFLAHVGGEELVIRLGEVHDDQTVQTASETFVDVERDETTVQFEVMFQEHGHSLGVGLEVADEARHMLKVEGATLQDVEIGVMQAHRAGRILGPHQREKVIGGAVVLEIGKDELLRGLTVLGIDAHRAE